jgi:5-methylcytosine-specific restriction endonuclease McrA
VMAHIVWTEADAPLIESVRALKNLKIEWSTQNEIIKNYRARLLVLQNYRCAYCQSPIESTANGYLELDHILPKLPSGSLVSRIQSNEFDDRRVTNGYKYFTFEPKNLVIACKACNSAKGTFDACSDRSKRIRRYPTGKSITRLVTWFHPHFHDYDEHIILNENWTYTHNDSPHGDYTIRACKLHLPEELEKRFQVRANVSLEHSPNIRVALYSMATSVYQHRYGREQAVTTLVERCALSPEEATDLLDAWILHVSTPSIEDFDKANKALLSVAIIWESKKVFDTSANELNRMVEDNLIP